MSIDKFVMTLRRGEGRLGRLARQSWRSIQRVHLPLPRWLAGTLYAERRMRRRTWRLLLKALYREPLLRYRCESVGVRLGLEGELPLIIGDGRIVLGNDVRIGARNTWIVGFKVSESPELVVGDRVSINYQTTISVAKRVEIGDDTMIAGNVQIYDNISHPLSPSRRLKHESFTLDEAEPVRIGRNVWIGNGAIIMRGVTIGDDSVVGAAAVVTKSVPAGVLVAGNPARVVRRLSGGE